MCPIPHGSGEVLEKFPDALSPPSIAVFSPPPSPNIPNAGLNSHDHYKRKLPSWRYDLRQMMLPLIRWETPYLAWMQNKMRSPALDTYFAITANLGTHVFFMTSLPILFWCGYTQSGRGLAHVLMTGVFVTGFIKDMLSLPRPLSPPLHRINMSGSAALEYGFPSTHSANAVSVAVYVLFQLDGPDSTLQPTTTLIVKLVAYCYMFSITLGRLYCGMHGFMDVIIGSAIGAFISIVECVYGASFERYLHNGSWVGPSVVAAIIILLVRIHPEPADDCPCFDDSVAVAGVMIGLELGSWHYAAAEWGWNDPVTAVVPFDFAHLGWPKVFLRVAVGVLMTFAWREVMKPLLLKSLPHLFRIMERTGYILPRRFFMPASEYKKIPSRLRVDNIMPSVSDIPSFLDSIRHPGRGRSVSIGPQSAADAYETLAYREKRRRDSLTSNGSATSKSRSRGPSRKEEESYFTLQNSTVDETHQANASGIAPFLRSNGASIGTLPTPTLFPVSSYEQMMGQGKVLLSPPCPHIGDETNEEEPEIILGHENELGEKEMFSKLEKPRRRYDVEVVTKLVVYSGIQISILH
ncbi:MAG: hypothetical protein M1818_001835 [Claussenomyces sp. TS43310]|nr:MAG: hypothetical protein M1818_001835 [Claussenomyces sp. TS43310]